ncbi:MAG: ABC transporter ATP-binding protein [Spirochaetes bacterium]|nr:MAG: ABC transporter ATP-binding protein [Spirochaetota bacterium]
MNTNNNTVIKTENLTKCYNETPVVNNLNLSVYRGEVFGILGPNGSGKTTTILMFLGLTEPSGGKVNIVGFDPLREPLEVKRRVGYMPDSVGFYDDITARANLRYTARLAGIETEETEKRTNDLLTQLELIDVADKKVGTFSRGMRQRLGLAEVLLKQPEVAILDEPTTGLDPEAAQEFLRLIRGLKGKGITILLSSHLLHQVQAICDRVGLFSHGRMVLEGTVEELSSKVIGGAYDLSVEASGNDLEEQIRKIPGVVEVELYGENEFHIEAKEDVREKVAAEIVRAGGKLLSLNMKRHSLDDIYARYFEEERDEAQRVQANREKA